MGTVQTLILQRVPADLMHRNICLMPIMLYFSGACDRKASHIKAVIKRYVNEGHDVTTADEMKTVSFEFEESF